MFFFASSKASDCFDLIAFNDSFNGRLNILINIKLHRAIVPAGLFPSRFVPRTCSPFTPACFGELKLKSDFR